MNQQFDDRPKVGLHQTVDATEPEPKDVISLEDWRKDQERRQEAREHGGNMRAEMQREQAEILQYFMDQNKARRRRRRILRTVFAPFAVVIEIVRIVRGEK